MGQHKKAGSAERRAGIPIRSGRSLLRPLKAAEIVAREVVNDIVENELAPGDSLNAEADMIKNYGVSRESVREGLRLLEVQGMINIRRGPGGGPSVGTVDPANLGRVEALFFNLAGATYTELFEAWVLAESTLAALAAANPDAELRKQLMEPYLDPEEAQHDHQDLESFVEAHESFHSAIARLSGNRVLELTFRAYGLLAAHHVAVVGDPRLVSDALEEDHSRLAEIIIAGERDAAESFMREHIHRVIDVNIKMLGDLVTGPVEWL